MNNSRYLSISATMLLFVVFLSPTACSTVSNVGDRRNVGNFSGSADRIYRFDDSTIIITDITETEIREVTAADGPEAPGDLSTWSTDLSGERLPREFFFRDKSDKKISIYFDSIRVARGLHRIYYYSVKDRWLDIELNNRWPH
jgi:hypothetical protein